MEGKELTMKQYPCLRTPCNCTRPLSAHAHSVHTPTLCTHPLCAHAHSVHTPTQCTRPLSSHAHSVHTPTQCTHPLSAHAHSVHTPTQCTRPLSAHTHSQCSRCTLAPASLLVWASCRRCGRRRRGDDACRSVWVGAQSLSHHRTQASYNIDHTTQLIQ